MKTITIKILVPELYVSPETKAKAIQALKDWLWELPWLILAVCAVWFVPEPYTSIPTIIAVVCAYETGKIRGKFWDRSNPAL